MEIYEINDIIDNLPYYNRPENEILRLLGYIQAQTHSSKKLSPTDIIKFPWDEEKSESDTNITNKQIETLREHAKKFENLLNKSV